jgi:hypothetical protein
MRVITFTSYLLLTSAVAFAHIPANTNDILKNSRYHVEGIFPNPVQTKGVITFSIDQGSEVVIEFFDLTGKKVKEMTKNITSKGINEIEFDATEMKSGVYLCKISTSGWVEAKRIIINH